MESQWKGVVGRFKTKQNRERERDFRRKGKDSFYPSFPVSISASSNVCIIGVVMSSDITGIE
jgi:hypothetical protein